LSNYRGVKINVYLTKIADSKASFIFFDDSKFSMQPFSYVMSCFFKKGNYFAK